MTSGQAFIALQYSVSIGSTSPSAAPIQRNSELALTFLRLHVAHPALDFRCGCRFLIGLPSVSIARLIGSGSTPGRTKKEKLPGSMALNVVFQLWKARDHQRYYNISPEPSMGADIEFADPTWLDRQLWIGSRRRILNMASGLRTQLWGFALKLKAYRRLPVGARPIPC
jgi:hypothetical protein